MNNNFKKQQFSKTILSFANEYGSSLLVLFAILGFVSKSLYNYPIGVMAIIGLYQTITNPKQLLLDNILKTYLFVFLALWIPLLISFIDAVNYKHSAHTVFPYIRFLFAGIFIINALSKNEKLLTFILSGIFVIITFWCVDASIQFIVGKNILGYPYRADIGLTGFFHPRNTISHICSILSTFCFLYVYKRTESSKWLILSIIPLFLVVLLSGRRAAWVMLALSTLAFMYYGFIYSENRTKFIKFFSVISTIIILLLSVTIIFHKPMNQRFISTMGLFSGDYEKINEATAIRLPIWETSYEIFKSNPINGIGPRGFRHVYKDFASDDDYFININAVPTQPHIIILEVLAETGLIGFIGYLIAFYLLMILIKKSRNKKELLPFFIPVVIAMFPFNTHMAFYGSIWSSMTWLLLALYFSKAKLVINNHP
jgi:O-antigen ligase